MKKLLGIVILLLAMLPTQAFASSVELKYDNNYKGVALVDLPKKNPNTKELQLPSTLKIEGYSYSSRSSSKKAALHQKFFHPNTGFRILRSQ